MKNFALTACLLFALPSLLAQGDFPTTKPIEIAKDNTLDTRDNDQGSALIMPSTLEPNLGRKETKGGIKMLPDRNLKQAGHDLKIKPNLSVLEGGGNKKFHGDMHLGNVKTRSENVGIAVRDHGEVDGDRILILVNGEITHYNQILSGSYLEIKIPLKEGFNTIEFKALNQGYTGLNTAQLLVVDELGEVIHNNNWYLSTGSTATAVVIKDPTLPEGFSEEKEGSR